jgi:hypothetical protein
MQRNSIDTWTVQLPGWILLAYLVLAQGLSAIDYELGVRMGTQEPAEQISEVGTAFWYGFAFADLVWYIPVLSVGLVGLWRRSTWSRAVAGAAFGITVYWPVVCLAALVDARGAAGWKLADETAYWIVLPVMAAWGLWALWRVARSKTN